MPTVEGHPRKPTTPCSRCGRRRVVRSDRKNDQCADCTTITPEPVADEPWVQWFRAPNGILYPIREAIAS